MSGTRLNMTKENAALLAELCLRHSAELDRFVANLKKSSDQADAEVARKVVGRIMGEIYVAALYPIFETYGDLKPPNFP